MFFTASILTVGLIRSPAQIRIGGGWGALSHLYFDVSLKITSDSQQIPNGARAGNFRHHVYTRYLYVLLSNGFHGLGLLSSGKALVLIYI